MECQNEGFIGKNCACYCPDGFIGEHCETLELQTKCIFFLVLKFFIRLLNFDEMSKNMIFFKTDQMSYQ